MAYARRKYPRKFFKKSSRRSGRMLRYTTPSWEGRSVRRTFDVSFPVYLINLTGPTQAYSFSTTTTKLFIECFNAASNTEFIRMQLSYLYYYVTGYKLQFVRSLNAANTTIFQLPEIYFDLIGNATSTQTNSIVNTTASSSDTAYKVQPLSTDSSPISRSYRFPSVVTGNQGYPNMGYSACMLASVPNYMNLLLGFNDSPNSSVAPDAQKVGAITIKFFCKFSKPINVG